MSIIGDGAEISFFGLISLQIFIERRWINSTDEVVKAVVIGILTIVITALNRDNRD